MPKTGQHRRTYGVCIVMLGCLAVIAGCPGAGGGGQVNPFFDLDPMAADGQSRAIQTTITPIGEMNAGDVFEFLIEGDAVDSFLILARDPLSEESGVIVGGGPPNVSVSYRVPERGAYFVFVQLTSGESVNEGDVMITVSPGAADFAPPASQAVLVTFEDDFLTGPGLFDTVDGTADELAVLNSISGQVQDAIIDRLVTIFAGTPIDIIDGRAGSPDAPFSEVTFSPDRELPDEASLAIDVAEPPNDASPDECQERVIFGEIEPRGTTFDPGNQDLDDRATVYVGSFQGLSTACRTAAINSVNNIVQGLAQTAAHEIGHLVGLQHVALVDIMDRSPSRAFQRELQFNRGQILTQSIVEGAGGESEAVTTVSTTVIQDPSVYFAAIFGE